MWQNERVGTGLSQVNRVAGQNKSFLNRSNGSFLNESIGSGQKILTRFTMSTSATISLFVKK